MSGTYPPKPSALMGHSLSFVTALWTAVVIALIMAGYAVLQKALGPQMSWQDLFLQHLWHVVVLGGVIQLVCWLVLRRLLGQPLNQIYLHLYAVGKGHLDSIHISSNIREIRSISEGINLMVWRMRQISELKALSSSREEIRMIKKQMHRLAAHDPQVATIITEQLEQLEKNLLKLSEEAPRSDTAGDAADERGKGTG